MRRVPLVCLSITLCACVSGPEPRARPAEPPARAPSLAEAAAAQEAATRPGRRHRELDPLVGAWKTTNVAVDLEGVESDPVPGIAAMDWTLGGRFLRLDAQIELPDGAKHASSGFLGWDEAHGEYQLLQVSDLQTGMGVAHGMGELGKGGIRFTLDVVDPRSGGFARATSVLRCVAPDHFVLEQIGADATGMERVVRRTHYRRAVKR
jgi:hypothetical protein